MNNFCDEEVFTDNNYTNTYSLWGNSKYYDIKNLSPQNYSSSDIGANCTESPTEFKASRWSASPSDGLAQEPPDSRNRRIIERESLYEDPDTFYKDVNIREAEDNTAKPTTIAADDWTQQFWRKASEKFLDSESIDSDTQGPSSKKQLVIGNNKIQKKLDKMLAVPVKMTKAESMMQKMGWQGGALGRTGDGIVEPIAPNAVYAKKKIGFGQSHVQIVKPPKNKKADSKLYYDMNVLLNIFEFVKNNNELELLFDRKLRKDERKRIHHLVEFKVKADDMAAVDFANDTQMDLVLQINDKNCYNLLTVSSGTQPYRQLCIYKEAPPHVYLIVPDDLKEDGEAETVEMPIQEALPDETPIAEEPAKIAEVKDVVIEDVEVEEETNPFLISITRNLKKKTDSECEIVEPEEKVKERVEEKVEEVQEVVVVPEIPPTPLTSKEKITNMIVEYFNEFVKGRKYSQFKFLGPFTEEEISAINEFLEQAMKFLSNEGDCPLASIFSKVAYQINEDATGNTVIYKTPIGERRKKNRKVNTTATS